MSEWMKTRTQFRLEHLQCLVDALGVISPKWQGHIESNPAGIAMYDYHRKAVTAQIVVRRPYAGGWGDLGFAAQADGTLELIADDGHRGSHAGVYGAGCVTDEWLGRVAQQYAGRVVEKQAEAAGLDVSKELREDGSWRYLLTKRGAVRSSAVERVW
jgi:hypothetical protein